MPTWAVFLLVLSVLVLVHELGHFAAAILLKIKVEELALGLPFTRPILKIRKGQTDYSIYPVLFGGFVKLHGEEAPQTGQAKPAKHASFWERGRKQRMVVTGAGVAMNLVLAVAGFVILYAIVGIPVTIREKVTVVQVAEGSPAMSAGIEEGDRIVGVEGKKITTVEEFSRLMQSWAGLGVNIMVERGKGLALFEGIVEKEAEQKVINVVPRAKPPQGEGPVGVVISVFPYLETGKCQMSNVKCQIEALGQGVKTTGVWVGRVVEGLRQVGKSLVAGRVPEGVAGPVGIYQLTGLVAGEGLLPMVELVAVLSVNLAVFNILPIPALDGGRMLFIWLEWVRRKRLSPAVERKINQWGFAFLIALMILISLQDVLRGRL